MAAKRRASKQSQTEQIVLSVAHVDFQDDHDGASFMQLAERNAAKRLAAGGYLKIVLETKGEIVAKLTKKGLRRIESLAREAPRSKIAREPKRADEREHLEDELRSAKSAYQKASDEYQTAKRLGPQDRISAAYKALGETSAAYENAELVLESYRALHARQ
jgi:hypothetical protein